MTNTPRRPHRFTTPVVREVPPLAAGARLELFEAQIHRPLA
jgi:hypothetical protein